MKAKTDEAGTESVPGFKSPSRWFVDLCLLCAIAIAVIALGTAARSQMMTGEGEAPLPDRRPVNWGTDPDIAFAKQLWPALLKAGLVGDDRLQGYPRKGEQPHGAFQQVTATSIEIAGAKRRAIVKANHRGEKLTLEKVWSRPAESLTGFAVMAKREAGYDEKNSNWFWAVFNPDGSLRQFQGRSIAGRVDTGNTNGCIGCHVKKGGRDLETMTAK